MRPITNIFAAGFAAASLAGTAFAAGQPPIGKTAPAFTLVDSAGVKHSLSDYKGKYVVLEWTNPGCPFVKKHYESGNMEKLQAEYTKKGVIWLTIDSSAPAEQGFLDGENAKKAKQEQYKDSTELLLDPTGQVGHEYHATNTPDMYIISPEGKLVYEGAIDSIPSADQSDISKATNYVKENLDAVMDGKPVADAVTKAYGCSVKYQGTGG